LAKGEVGRPNRRDEREHERRRPDLVVGRTGRASDSRGHAMFTVSKASHGERVDDNADAP
jgi:hypothetical protein